MSEHTQMGKNAKEMDPQMKVYLLVPPGSPDLRTTVGFKAIGSGEEFTFGFTNPEKAHDFVRRQKEKGAFGNSMGKEFRIYWLTLDEYLANPDNKLLYIDPPDDFHFDINLPNLN